MNNNLFNLFQQTPLLRLSLYLIGGILCGNFFTPLFSWTVLGCMLILSVLLALCMKDKDQVSILIMIATFALGACLYMRKAQQPKCTFPTSEINFEGVITSQPILKGKTWQCDLKVVSLENTLLEKPIKLRATFLRDQNQPMRLSLNNGIQATALIENIDKSTAKQSDPYDQYLEQQGYQAKCFIPYWNFQTISKRLTLPFFDRLQLKAALINVRLANKLTAETITKKEASSLLEALTLGNRYHLTSETKEQFSIAGGSHILALSGLHLGLIFGLCVFLLRRNPFSIAISILVIWTYAFIVGLPQSVIRSAIMLTTLSIPTMFKEKTISLNILALAVILMLIINPYTLWDISFQLSCLAVLSIMLSYHTLHIIWAPKNILLKWGWNMIIVSIAAQLLTFPLILHYFGRFSPYFILTNFMIIPLATILLYLTPLLLFLSFSTPLLSILLSIVTTIASVVIKSIHFISTLPGANITIAPISTLQTILLYIAVFLIMMAVNRLIPKKHPILFE